jgi:hypothetical protein
MSLGETFPVLAFLAFGLFSAVVPIVFAVWLFVTIQRMRRQIDQLSSRIDGLIESATDPRHAGHGMPTISPIGTLAKER